MLLMQQAACMHGMQKAVLIACCAVLCCRPMPEAPKADPLGRNLEGKGQQELPPGYVDEAEAAAERAKQGGRATLLIARAVPSSPCSC
jgi:hypothetical protein